MKFFFHKALSETSKTKEALFHFNVHFVIGIAQNYIKSLQLDLGNNLQIIFTKPKQHIKERNSTVTSPDFNRKLV